MKTIQVQGSTGSIGTNTLSIIKEHQDKFKVKTLSAQSNWQKLAEQAIEFNAENVIIEDSRYYLELNSKLKGKNINVFAGRQDMIALAQEAYDISISAIMGIAALEPTLASIKNSQILGLANKESIICASEFILREAKKYNTTIIPLDSEHNAIYQIITPSQTHKIRSMILTASGGPFRTKSLREMEDVTPEQAVNHPNWKMGAKISVDSATLMNKGLEFIEACKLFALMPSQIEVVVHPESVIHGIVNYSDGSSIAQLSHPNMRVPIAYALQYPNRLEIEHKYLDLIQLQKLHFEAPDYEKFPLLKLAIEVADQSQSEIIAFNVANEVAVNAFLKGKIKFLDIHRITNNILSSFTPQKIAHEQDVLMLVSLINDQVASILK